MALQSHRQNRTKSSPPEMPATNRPPFTPDILPPSPDFPQSYRDASKKTEQKPTIELDFRRYPDRIQPNIDRSTPPEVRDVRPIRKVDPGSPPSEAHQCSACPVSSGSRNQDSSTGSSMKYSATEGPSPSRPGSASQRQTPCPPRPPASPSAG